MNQKLIFVCSILLGTVSLNAQEGRLQRFWQALSGWLFKRPAIKQKNPIEQALDDLDTAITKEIRDNSLTEDGAKKYYLQLQQNYREALKQVAQGKSIKPEMIGLALRNARMLREHIRFSLDEVTDIKGLEDLVVLTSDDIEYVIIILYNFYEKCMRACKENPDNESNKNTAKILYRKIMEFLPKFAENTQKRWKLRAKELKKICSLS